MSALTKVFIVLHVVLTMLLTAGLIVFVNRTENWKQVSADTQAKLVSAQQAERELNVQLQVVKADDNHKITALQGQLASAQNDIGTAQQTISSKDAQIAQLTSDAAVKDNQITNLGEAVKVAQAQNGEQQKTIAKLREDESGLQKQNNDLNLAVSKLNNQLEVTERQRRNLAEESVQQASDLKAAQDIIHESHLDRGQTATIIDHTPTIPLSGVVRDKRVIAGVPYATISLGSADAVQKNMQFKVIDPARNQFLGYLTVDTVEPHEATGRLSGPHPDAVHAGVEVRTQL